jgi:hypothetical protein
VSNQNRSPKTVFGRHVGPGQRPPQLRLCGHLRLPVQTSPWIFPSAADENMEDGDAIDAMAEQIGGRR